MAMSSYNSARSCKNNMLSFHSTQWDVVFILFMILSKWDVIFLHCEILSKWDDVFIPGMVLPKWNVVFRISIILSAWNICGLSSSCCCWTDLIYLCHFSFRKPILLWFRFCHFSIVKRCCCHCTVENAVLRKWVAHEKGVILCNIGVIFLPVPLEILCEPRTRWQFLLIHPASVAPVIVETWYKPENGRGKVK